MTSHFHSGKHPVLCLLAAVAMSAFGHGNECAAADLVAGASVTQFGDWTVVIQPGWSTSGSTAPVSIVPGPTAANGGVGAIPPTPPSPASGATAGVPCVNCGTVGDRTDLARQYAAVYAQIPFSRSEFNAFHGYRHNATMEILTGQLRPMNFQTTNVSVYNESFGGLGPYSWYPYLFYQPYGIDFRTGLPIRRF